MCLFSNVFDAISPFRNNSEQKQSTWHLLYKQSSCKCCKVCEVYIEFDTMQKCKNIKN